MSTQLQQSIFNNICMQISLFGSECMWSKQPKLCTPCIIALLPCAVWLTYVEDTLYIKESNAMMHGMQRGLCLPTKSWSNTTEDSMQIAHASHKAWSSCSTSDLTQITAQKKTPSGMLHALTQLHQVLQDVLGSSLLAAYVAAANSTQ